MRVHNSEESLLCGSPSQATLLPAVFACLTFVPLCIRRRSSTEPNPDPKPCAGHPSRPVPGLTTKVGPRRAPAGVRGSGVCRACLGKVPPLALVLLACSSRRRSVVGQLAWRSWPFEVPPEGLLVVVVTELDRHTPFGRFVRYRSGVCELDRVQVISRKCAKGVDRHLRVRLPAPEHQTCGIVPDHFRSSVLAPAVG